MEREQWHESMPELKRESGSETAESTPISDPVEAEREAPTVQSIAGEMAESGFASESGAVHYEAASRDLEHLKETDVEFAEELISASVAEVELREKIGPARFELFKQVQNEVLGRAAEDYRHQFRALLETKDAIPSQRYDRLRVGVVQIVRELYAKFLRQIAADERTKEACAWNATILKQALKTFDNRLNAELTRVGDAEIDKYHADKNQTS
jgi:hypothetical protein